MNLLDHIRGLAAASETDFVTAGCTLDAAGKIYSCRVDSVHTETFRCELALLCCSVVSAGDAIFPFLFRLVDFAADPFRVHVP